MTDYLNDPERLNKLDREALLTLLHYKKKYDCTCSTCNYEWNKFFKRLHSFRPAHNMDDCTTFMNLFPCELRINYNLDTWCTEAEQDGYKAERIGNTMQDSITAALIALWEAMEAKDDSWKPIFRQLNELLKTDYCITSRQGEKLGMELLGSILMKLENLAGKE